MAYMPISSADKTGLNDCISLHIKVPPVSGNSQRNITYANKFEFGLYKVNSKNIALVALLIQKYLVH